MATHRGLDAPGKQCYSCHYLAGNAAIPGGVPCVSSIPESVTVATTMNSETIGAKIQDALSNQDGLIAVYLFGSVAEGKAHRLSDVDVAVLFDDELNAEQIFQRTLAMGGLLEQVLQRAVDVVPLNRAGPLLRFQVIQKGKVLLERDRTERCLFHMRTMAAYYDAKPYLDYQRSEAIRRIREKGLGHGYQGHRNALAEVRKLRTTLARSETCSAG